MLHINVIIVVHQNFNLFDFSCCVEPLLASERYKHAYTITFASLRGGTIRSRTGVAVCTAALATVSVGTADRVILIGASSPLGRSQASALGAWLRALPTNCRLCGVGDGVGVLARAVALGGDLSEHSPMQNAEAMLVRSGQLAVRQGSAWLGIGRATTLDLILTLLAEDLGRAHALRVAEALLLHVWRQPDEALSSAMIQWQKRSGARFAALHDHVRTHLSDDLSVERLADWCSMTPRTFARLYRRETGATPAAAICTMRLEAARLLIKDRCLTLSQIAYQVGFRSELTFRRAFIRAYGELPI